MSKANPYAAYTTNANEEIEGVYINYGSFRVKVARAGGSNRAYVQAQDRKVRALRRTGTPSAERLEAIGLELVAENCIKAWEVDQDGKWVSGMTHPQTLEVVPFNLDNVKLIFKLVPDLAKAIQAEAASLDLFREEELKEEAGN